MRKIKVLHIISELGDGGVEAMLMDIYRNIDYKSIEFIFVVQSNKRRYEDEIKELGGKIYQVSPLHDVGVIAYIKEIIHLCKLEQIKILHCHNLTQNLFLLMAAKMAGVKIRISHSHLTTAFSKKAEICMPFIRWGINYLSTNRLACGREAGKFLYGKKDFIVIKNAIDVDKFLYAMPLNLQRELKITNEKNILLHVGRLAEQKNHGYLIEIMKEIKKHRDDIILCCCGTGPLTEEITQNIKKNNLENNIFLLGSRSDIPRLMKSAKILLLPSLYEGFPVTLVEAQASGISALVSNTIDKDSDLGLGLIKFLSIDKNNKNEWVNSIYKLLEKKNSSVRFLSIDTIKRSLEEKGYSSKKNSKILEKIYILGEKEGKK